MPSASQSSQQSFSMSQPQSQPRHSVPFQHPSNKATSIEGIYSSSYSGIDLYEMEVNGVVIMRRRHDSWLNATQILKVAGLDKGKRTKILEKEIQTGEHEKVQGGYGKYQGTWIAFDRGVQVCRQYGVEDLLRPLLTYDMGQDGGVAGRGDLNTPTKEQAMAAQRKRLYNSNAAADSRANGLSGTFFKNISTTASHAVAAISKARFDSPGPRNRNVPSRPPSFSRQPSLQKNNENHIPNSTQQSFASEYGQQQTDASSYQTQPQNGTAPIVYDNEPPRKRQRVTMTPADSYGSYNQHVADAYPNAGPVGSPTEPNDSFLYNSQGAANDVPQPEEGYGTLPPLPPSETVDIEEKRSMLIRLFMDPGSSPSDPSTYNMLHSYTPAELDMPIDPQSHTALHWAATLARMPLLRALIAAGASPWRVNASGETALMRACLVTNSMDHGSFPDLLDVLGGTIEARDNKGRTVLHHISVTSAVKGRSAASRYYLESLLEWVVRQGSAPNSQPDQPNGTCSGNMSTMAPKMGIARFMSEIVNAQDASGDTALNIASRIGNRSIISQLLEVSADPEIANRVGLRPSDFGIGKEESDGRISGHAAEEVNGVSSVSQRSSDKNEDIMTSIARLLDDTAASYQQDLRDKQASLDTLHATLRLTSGQLGESKKTVESLMARLKKQQLARQKIANLVHAREDDQIRISEQSASAPPSSAWETELAAMLEAVDVSEAEGQVGSRGMLPPPAVLRARIRAIEGRRDYMRKMVHALKGRSREVEIKYRRVVALCTGVQDCDVDPMVDGLLKAVRSEGEELDIGRVRRFLGGIDGPVD
ncbi:hypothetical protein CDD82_5515 [Ophiocordyceps australis]|uniref:Transcription factor SWI6 n=1 Tax=Ophiocordyceps australis TaxID=1399860 RepID=A0A2C5ZRX7_9HYPO|nr:hypothetical protein CDD82_5515 [Ophiocordyceps australis]